jgi:hypothetical protein
LELHFQTAKLREICEKRNVAAVELSYPAARELAERLADIEAVDNVPELCELLGAAISDKSPTEKCLNLSSGFVVIFQSAHPWPTGSTPEATDWGMTTRMKVIAIEPVNG